MERWRFYAAGTVLSIVFLVCLVLIAEVGRTRLRTASEQLQATMARRVVVGELRERMAEAALGCRSYLLTGDHAHLATVREAGRAVNATADRLIVIAARTSELPTLHGGCGTWRECNSAR